MADGNASISVLKSFCGYGSGCRVVSCGYDETRAVDLGVESYPGLGRAGSVRSAYVSSMSVLLFVSEGVRYVRLVLILMV